MPMFKKVSGISISCLCSFLIVFGNRKEYAKMLRSSLPETQSVDIAEELDPVNATYFLFRISRIL